MLSCILCATFLFLLLKTATWLAHVDERWTTVWEVGVQDPDQTLRVLQ